MKPRISVMTFNLWGNEYLTERSENLCKMLMTIHPDLLMLQEVTTENLLLVQKSLPTHHHIGTKESLGDEGRLLDNNIFWDNSIFHSLESGFMSFNHPEYSQRGLHWVRLAFHENEQNQFIIATTHFPWVGSREEISSGVNQRIQCSKLVLSFINSIRKSGEPVIFGGDLNDDFHPLRILCGDNQQDNPSNISLRDVFEILDLPPQITHPVRPSDSREEMRVTFSSHPL
jgi:exonuclease III